MCLSCACACAECRMQIAKAQAPSQAARHPQCGNGPSISPNEIDWDVRLHHMFRGVRALSLRESFASTGLLKHRKTERQGRSTFSTNQPILARSLVSTLRLLCASNHLGKALTGVGDLGIPFFMGGGDSSNPPFRSQGRSRISQPHYLARCLDAAGQTSHRHISRPPFLGPRRPLHRTPTISCPNLAATWLWGAHPPNGFF